MEKLSPELIDVILSYFESGIVVQRNLKQYNVLRKTNKCISKRAKWAFEKKLQMADAAVWKALYEVECWDYLMDVSQLSNPYIKLNVMNFYTLFSIFDTRDFPTSWQFPEKLWKLWSQSEDRVNAWKEPSINVNRAISSNGHVIIAKVLQVGKPEEKQRILESIQWHYSLNTSQTANLEPKLLETYDIGIINNTECMLFKFKGQKKCRVVTWKDFSSWISVV